MKELPRSPVRRTGFTLIELLVVIAIIAVLIGLLVPAVQKVRSAANRVSCSNNLKNIGIALHNYHSAYGVLPPAFKLAGASVAPGWGWGTFILPYIEQLPLYQLLDPDTQIFGNTSGGPTNPALPNAYTVSPIKTYRCAADNGTDLNGLRFGHATSNYRAVAGGGVLYPVTFSAGQDMGGVMYQNSKVKFESVTDGTSNTLLVGECAFNPNPAPSNGPPQWGAIWAGMTGLNTDGARVSDVMWWVDQGNSYINGSNPQSFSSSHEGGAYFVFCDGSVRFFSSGLDKSAFTLAIRNDGLIPKEYP